MVFTQCLLLPLLVLHAHALENAIRSASSNRARLSSHTAITERKIDSDPQGVTVPPGFKNYRKLGEETASTYADSVKLPAQGIERARFANQLPDSSGGAVAPPHGAVAKPNYEGMLHPHHNVAAKVSVDPPASNHHAAGILEKHAPALVEAAEGHEPEGEHGSLGEHGLALFVVTPVALAMLTAILMAGLLERYEISWLPESVVTLSVGACLGFYMQWLLRDHAMFISDEVFRSTCASLITLFLLPILIFQSGWSLRTIDFTSEFEHILVFAIFGSLISFVVVGFLIYWTGGFHLGWHHVSYPRTAFAYASLIAATDPVATLNTYSKLKVDPLLNIMVFGDSTFNDAVAIVLFKVLNNDQFMGKPDSRPGLGQISLNVTYGILKIFSGSLIVGLLLGAAFLLVLRFTHMRHAPRLEILALVAHGYLTFAVAEDFGLSGIVATTFCSMLLGIYARPHLSAGGSIMSDFFLKQVANVMDTAIFLLTGFCVVKVTFEGAWFCLFAMLFCLVGRACAVFPMGLLTNQMKKLHDGTTGKDTGNLLSTKALFMMWHAGLRGGIALALCMELGPWVDALDGPGTANVLHSATFLLIVVFLIVFGGSTEAFLVKLGVPHGDSIVTETLSSKNLYKGRARFRLMKYIDEKIMVPIFIADAASVDNHIKEMEIEDVLENNTLLRPSERRQRANYHSAATFSMG